MVELNKLKYAELQKLAKAASIRANQKYDVLVAELSKHYEKQNKKENLSDKAAKRLSNKNTPLNSPVVSSKTTTPKQAIQKAVKTSNHAVRSPLPKSVITPKSTPSTKPAEKKSTPRVPTTSASKKNSTPQSAKHTPIMSRWEKKVFTPSKVGQSTSKTNTPVSNTRKRKSTDSVSTPESQPKKRRSTFEKAPTPSLKTPEIEAGTPTQKRRSSRAGSSLSPGVKEMLGAMKSDMNDQEMKDSLMSVIDKKVQDKCKSGEKSTTKASSNIPRFAAFLKKRQEATKPITPGNKDWNKIHKKNFDKFDSIDTYLQKKRKRAEDIATSIKKVKVITEEVTSAMKKLKSHKTPETMDNNKFKKPRLSNPNKTSPFKPMVFNTKNMNLNFNAKKTPKTLPRKSPNAVLCKEIKENTTVARKSTGTHVLPRKSMTTPFKFTAGNTLNMTVTSTKKAFNLKESLAKPLKYKPHTGKLKPIEPTGPASSTLKAKFVSATKTTKNRENIKSSIAQRRANKKMNSAMSRRGIKM